MKFISKIAVTAIFILLCSAEELLAQVPPPPDPAAIPLDPLSWVLLAAGGGIASKKYYDFKKNN